MLDDVVALTSELIAYPSITPHDKGCQKVLVALLSKLGFTIEHYPHQDTSNFWAILGNSGPLFCFAGHTDVVPTGPLGEWNTDPFKATINDGFLYGRGAADMKGEIAAMCIACKQFLKKYPDFPGRIAFLITSAEEGPSETGTPIVLDALAKQGVHINYCLVGEPTAVKQTGDMIKIGRRGSLSGHLIIHGKQGHIAYPHLADNPVHHALPALAKLVATSWDQGNESFQPTSLQISNMHSGSGAGNVIPGDCEVQFNFRYTPIHTHETLIRQTENVLQQHGLNYSLNWDHSGKPFLTKPGRLVDITKEAIETTTGLQPELSTSGGTSDGRFIVDYCDEIIECGISNKTIHQINECASLKDLAQITDVYYHILTRIFEDSA